MSDEGDVVAPTEVAVAAPAIPEPVVYDETSAVKEVLKKALVYDGIARGLREATKALEKGQVCC
jgi:small subunit ribosomal protein S12e